MSRVHIKKLSQKFKPLKNLRLNDHVKRGSLLLINKIDPIGQGGTLGVTPGYNAVFYGSLDTLIVKGSEKIRLGRRIRGVRVYQSISVEGTFYTPSDSTIFYDRIKGLLLPFNYCDVSYEYQVLATPRELSLKIRRND